MPPSASRGAGVLVVGCGAIGLLWMQVLLRRGDDGQSPPTRDSRRLACARGARGEVGAGPVDGGGRHRARPASTTRYGALDPGGTVLVFSAPSGEVPTSLDAVYRKELRVVGSRSATPAYFRAAIELLPRLELPPVTTVLPLERIPPKASTCIAAATR